MTYDVFRCYSLSECSLFQGKHPFHSLLLIFRWARTSLKYIPALKLDLVNVNLIYNSSCLVVLFSLITMSANRAAFFLTFDEKVTIHYKILTQASLKSSNFWYILLMLDSSVITILRWFFVVVLKSLLWIGKNLYKTCLWFQAALLCFSRSKSTFWHSLPTTKFRL